MHVYKICAHQALSPHFLDPYFEALDGLDVTKPREAEKRENDEAIFEKRENGFST